VVLDGIPETLPPVGETAERSPFAPNRARATLRKRIAPLPKHDDDESLERETDEAHVVDDLA